MRKIFGVVFLLVLTAGTGLQAQAAADEAAWVRQLSEKKTATVGDGIVLTAMLAGLQTLDYAKALDYLTAKKIVRTGPLDSSAALTSGQLSLWVMRAKGMKGGLIYSLFGGRRYAHRELVFRGMVPAKYSEYHKLQGSELLAVIGRAAGDVDLSMQNQGGTPK